MTSNIENMKPRKSEILQVQCIYDYLRLPVPVTSALPLSSKDVAGAVRIIQQGNCALLRRMSMLTASRGS